MRFPFSFRSHTEFGVFGFGTNAVDFLIEVPEYPNFNSKTRLSNFTRAPGGEVATTMVGLQRLGVRTSYAGRFGDDDAGTFGRLSLQEEGVDLSYSEVVEGASTQIAFIVIDERNGERTVIWDRDEDLRFEPDKAPIEAIERSQVLHFTPHDVEACAILAKEARRSGVIVSADIDDMFDGAEELFSLVDVFIAAADLPSKLFGPIEKRAALRRLRELFGCRVMGLTQGQEGSLLLCEDVFIETRGYAVPGGCRDTTGAGDSFRVGLLYGMLKGETIEIAAQMANAVAALKCRAVGARTALPTESELVDLMKNT